jgi:hypothetical protein
MMIAELGPFRIEDLPAGREPLWHPLGRDFFWGKRCLVHWRLESRVVVFDHSWIDFLSVLAEQLFRATRRDRGRVAATLDDDVPDLYCRAGEKGTVEIAADDSDETSGFFDHLDLMKDTFTLLYSIGRDQISKDDLKNAFDHPVICIPIGLEMISIREGAGVRWE